MLRSLFVVMALSALLLAGGSCDKLKKLDVPGNIAGRVLNADGSPRGYVSVLLMNEGGVEVQRQNAEDSGTFMFSKVPGGTYSCKVMSGATTELPTEPQTFKLGMGKTKQVEIKLLPVEQK